MKKRWFAVLPLVVLDALTLATGYGPSRQDTSPEGVPVHMVITAEGPMNPYVDSAMEEAQRAGIIVYAIYATGRD
jgi:hypothetical protein